MRDFPLRAWAYTLAVALSAATLCAILARHYGGFDGREIIGFGLLILAAEAVPVELPHASYSVGFVVVIAAIIAVGPGAACAAAIFGAFDLAILKRPDWAGRLVFNGAQLSLSTGVAGLAYKSVGGTTESVTSSDFPKILLPILAATAAHFLVNVGLVSRMVSLVKGTRWTELWHSDYKAASLSYFSFAAFGVLLAFLYLNVGWGGIAFLLLPLLVARGAFHASARVQVAFDSVLKSLVAAIEVKDLYTRGHAERVSKLSEMIARQKGLTEPQVRRVRYAALMHDVGKLTVDTRILQKPGKLSPEEFEHMKVHPIRGSEIVADVEMLSDMVDGVRHHHERLDGRGYPDGLAGEELSSVARIIMVADAFDSMTSTRSYRRAMPLDAAFSELRRCQGSQFAEEMIDALEEAILRFGWDPSPELYRGELTPRPSAPAHALGG